LLEPIHPDEKRLLSYAVDQAVRVTPDPQNNSSRVTSVSASKGVVIVHNMQVAAATYVVRNAADEPRTVVVEHPIRVGYTLDDARVDGGAAMKAAEKTPAVYRFRVVAKPNQTVHLLVTETMPGETRYELTDSTDSQLNFLLIETMHDAMFEAALKPVLDARRHVADLQEIADRDSSQLNDLRSDEDRQRQNVTALESADKASRERFVHDLNATEDLIKAAQQDVTTAEANLQTAKDDLANKIESLQIDQSISPGQITTQDTTQDTTKDTTKE
jgi:hypothetical protein